MPEPVEPVELPDVYDPAQQAHQMRLQGASWTQIAQSVPYPSPVAARLAVAAYLTRAAAEMDKAQKAEALELELDRLDQLQLAWWSSAVTGDDKAATVVLNVMRHRSKLLGLEVQEAEQKQSKTIVIAGSPQEYVEGLRRVVEGSTEQ